MLSLSRWRWGSVLVLAVLALLVSFVAVQLSAADERKSAPANNESRRALPLESQAISGTNKQAVSAIELAQGRSDVGRLGVMQKTREFDAAAYARDPSAYLDIAEPGRVWDVAEPKEGVVSLEPISPVIVEMNQLATTRLEVVTAPSAPVTFTSFDLGKFSNGLTTITVQANGKGSAAAEFIASEGTVENVNVLAGSPSASGQVLFSIQIIPPDLRR